MNKPTPDLMVQSETNPYPPKASSYFDAEPPPHAPSEFENMLEALPSAEGDDPSIVRSGD